MSDTKTAVGTLDGIMEKGADWHEIHVSIPGKQYPLKISTKKAELIDAARAAGSNVMEWTYSEHDSGNPNPHRPGENFINRYFEGVAPVGTTPGAASAAAAPESGMSKEEWRAKDRAADKRACIAIAAGALTHTIPGQPDDEALKSFAARTLRVAQVFADAVERERGGNPDNRIPF